jgi:hypothetical protein
MSCGVLLGDRGWRFSKQRIARRPVLSVCVCVYMCVAAVSHAHVGSWLPASLEILRVLGAQRCCWQQAVLVMTTDQWVLVVQGGTPPLFWPAAGCVHLSPQMVLFVHGGFVRVTAASCSGQGVLAMDGCWVSTLLSLV